MDAAKLASPYQALNEPWGTTINEEPTMTDQSAAEGTEINVILKQFGITGQAPGNARQPLYGDFTGLPTDLRGYIEQSRSIEELQAKLPDELKGMNPEELLSLTADELADKLKKPEPPAPKEEPK